MVIDPLEPQEATAPPRSKSNITAARHTRSRVDKYSATHIGLTLAPGDLHLSTIAGDTISTTQKNTATALARSTSYVHAATNTLGRRASRDPNTTTSFFSPIATV